MSAPQTAFENCVSNNGSLIPIPGRDVMVQAWYQGGMSVFDWTDAAHPKEVAFFDWGPVDATKLADGGSWSAYWYNGYIVSSEIARGLDIFELRPSGLISQNEIDAAKLVHLDYFNTQGQPKIVWPASFVVARAYLDQLARSNGVAPDSVSALRNDLGRAEKLAGQPRRDELARPGGRLGRQAPGAAGPAVSCASVFSPVSAAGAPFGPDPAMAEQPAGSLQSYGITASFTSPNELLKWPW